MRGEAFGVRRRDEVLAFLGLPRGVAEPVFERHNARPRTSDMDPGVRQELTAHYAAHDDALSASRARGHLQHTVTTLRHRWRVGAPAIG